MTPVNKVLPDINPLLSGFNRPLKMSFEDHLNILAHFHLVEHPSGPQLLQVLMEEHFAQQHIAPLRGIEKSSFFCLHKMIKQDTSLLPPVPASAQTRYVPASARSVFRSQEF